MPDKLAAHDCNIVSTGVVLIVLKKAGAVFEIGVLESKLAGAVVHARNKGLLRAAQMLCHRNGAVVCRNDADALEHFVNAHLFALLETQLPPKDAARSEAMTVSSRLISPRSTASTISSIVMTFVTLAGGRRS